MFSWLSQVSQVSVFFLARRNNIREQVSVWEPLVGVLKYFHKLTIAS